MALKLTESRAIGICYNEQMGRVYRRNCSYCKQPYKGLGALYCSQLCSHRARVNDEFRKKLSDGQKKSWTPERRKWRSEFNKEQGIKPYWPEGFVYKVDISGDKNPNWRGGRTLIGQAIRGSKAYKEWRKAVYVRDGYACVWCGVPGNGKNLNADHIKPFWSHPDLRLDIDNGRTLCVDCHKKTGTWGRPPKKCE